jgi:hypothetical protein
VQIVTPATVVRWHRRAFRLWWNWKSRPRQAGRPPVAADIRILIRRIGQANPLWGVPRVHGELLKLGVEVSPTTAAKYLPRRRYPHPPSPTWRAFLRNHADRRSRFLHGIDAHQPSAECTLTRSNRLSRPLIATGTLSDARGFENGAVLN